MMVSNNNNDVDPDQSDADADATMTTVLILANLKAMFFQYKTRVDENLSHDGRVSSSVVEILPAGSYQEDMVLRADIFALISSC